MLVLDDKRLLALAANAGDFQQRALQNGHNYQGVAYDTGYGQGVRDVLRWLAAAPPTDRLCEALAWPEEEG